MTHTPTLDDVIQTRQRLETLEDQALASYAVRSRDSRGRAFPEDEPIERTRFQRDRDRVLHTTAFRRLEYKTQVFVNYEGDYYRTRLTHTLEVAQIGRTLARALGANEDLVEAVCLAHDLGHPPFGHAGESALARLMAEHGGFDHNRQSLRIVTELERRFPEFPGLNLTWEVREGIVKHETEYDVSDAAGYEPEKRGTLEAQLANVADELAYTAHDLDDGLRSGLIAAEQLVDLDIWAMVSRSLGWTGLDLDELSRHRLIRRLIGLEVNDLLQATAERIHKSGLNFGRLPAAPHLQRGRVLRGDDGSQPPAQGLPLPQHVSALPGGAHAGEGRFDPGRPVSGVHPQPGNPPGAPPP